MKGPSKDDSLEGRRYVWNRAIGRTQFRDEMVSRFGACSRTKLQPAICDICPHSRAMILHTIATVKFLYIHLFWLLKCTFVV